MQSNVIQLSAATWQTQRNTQGGKVKGRVVESGCIINQVTDLFAPRWGVNFFFPTGLLFNGRRKMAVLPRLKESSLFFQHWKKKTKKKTEKN